MSFTHDVAVLVPFEQLPGSWTDPVVRSELAPARRVAVRASHKVAELLGVPEADPFPTTHRSLTSVALATSLERAGLCWRVLDPGAISLGDWRRRLEKLRADPPRAVAISSTFIIDGYWLATLCELTRRALPESRIVVGGYYYATDARKFLSVDADVLCVGEGERRIVQIVEAIRDGRSLEAIPGLYLREGQRLHYTGDAEPIPPNELPTPDWTLSSRIEPPVDIDQAINEISVESQRGCIFKCQFCTFRTLAAPVQGSVDRAVSSILAAPGRGSIFLVDATATSPRERWVSILRKLIAAGGTRLPLEAFARVSDLDEEVCALMAQAGISRVRIGQESGDQRMLNAMRKGTRVDQVAPGMAMLARHGIRAFLTFIYGFPGETAESVRATRRLIRSLNDGHEAAPVVHGVSLNIFDAYSFAEVRERKLEGLEHRYEYGHLSMPARRAADLALETYIELAKIPHAPPTSFEVGSFLLGFEWRRRALRDPYGFFKWSKSIDRAIAAFAEQDVYGTRPVPSELRELRAEILAGTPPPLRLLSAVGRARMAARHRAIWLLMEEWGRKRPGVGPLTRLALAREVYAATGRWGEGFEALKTGRYPEIGIVPGDNVAQTKSEAARLVRLGVATGHRRLAKAG
jgi:anaerobic magnesium-protoporphyrin IX monomethyl ester cyclase